MDDRGCLAQPLKRMARWRSPIASLAAARDAARTTLSVAGRRRCEQVLDRWLLLLDRRMPRRLGLAVSAFFIFASGAYGTATGNHLASIIQIMRDARDEAANAAGFRIVTIALAGNRHISREEILATSGITGSTSLLFLDVEETRARLEASPWIAEATVLKLYPSELQIGIKERKAFALWQKNGRLSVISDDGTVLEPYVAPQLRRLPLVVGTGAQTRAKELLALLDRHPALRDQVRASILVAERRWNLRLHNGINVWLPELEVAAALERLVALERAKHLTTRDIVSIDLRLRDRVTVRLSDAAAQIRLDAIKDRAKKNGGNA
jgi:cell division protein FtsQ